MNRPAHLVVDPYKRPPVPPTVCLLTPEGEVLDERGRRVSFDEWPDGYRCWTDWDTARGLVHAGRGEALCWNGEAIRWRHRRFEEEWRNRPSDVSVLKVPFPGSPRETLRGLAAWRDWLAGYRASPNGTSGSAAWSLLRATLEAPLFCSFGERPRLVQTMGGRVEPGAAGAGAFEGRLAHVDLQAAYARELAELRYGGRWYASSDAGSWSPEQYAAVGCPVFVSARVRLPGEEFGPLIRRPRRRMTQLELVLSQAYEERFPRHGTIAGFWTWQELVAAELAGARIIEVREWWVHLATAWPFRRWWQAVEQGRELPGLAGLLAKMTGNALVGRFAMDSAVQGSRTIASRNGSLTARALPDRGGLPPAHDLAETVTGRVRAELGLLMHEQGANLLSAHTDGAWLAAEPGWSNGARPGRLVAGEWRVKELARRLELVDPQTLRYWRRGRARPHVVYAGVPAREAPERFEETWQRLLQEEELER